MMMGGSFPLPIAGEPHEKMMMEVGAELITLGAATIQDGVMCPTPQAEELALSLLPKEWLHHMGTR
jgi:hypothetical protein